MPPAPLRRKRPGPEATQDCDCCAADCDCADCERCAQDAVQVARDWIPPPAQAAGDAKAPAGAKGASKTTGKRRGAR